MERRQADVVGRDVELEDAALGRAVLDAHDRVRDVLLELLLGADHGALGRVGRGDELVDVDADGVDAWPRRRPGGRRCRSGRRPGT